ncbi:MAG: sulfotransferase domain-containing protein [Proteobacteria bacterium]|nr:sulfotransferase domain-containing protein [Pseudomonadota bacterium]
MSDLPQKTESYLGTITDTSRWQNFRHRPDDIFICTPPKCGTTWTQAICAMLVFGRIDHGQQPGLISPWIDANFAPIEAYLTQIDQQTHRRFIKTHTPLDGIPYYPECTYLVVCRDPRDAYFSGLNHRDNLNDPTLAALFPSGQDSFHDWLYTVQEAGTWDQQTLDSFAHFVRSYWQYRDLPNLHLFHYTDMRHDLLKAVTSMADVLGVEYDANTLNNFANAASFESMKNRPAQFAPESGTGMWKAEAKFFASGSVRQWEGQLSDRELALFNTRINNLLPPDAVNWLLKKA